MILLALGVGFFIGEMLLVLFLRGTALGERNAATSAELYQRDCGDENTSPWDLFQLTTTSIAPFAMTRRHSPLTPWIGLTQAERDLWLDALGFYEPHA